MSLQDGRPTKSSLQRCLSPTIALNIQANLRQARASKDRDMALELVFDFDGTITESDSIASVVDAALSYRKSASPPETYHSLTDAWSHIVKSYMADLEDYRETSNPTIQHNHTTPLDAARAQFSNDQRRQIERDSLLRVKEAGLFRGVPVEHLFRSGQTHRDNDVVKLRNGFSDFIDLIRSPSVRSPPPRGGANLAGCVVMTY